jgi:hypothetical protein
MKFAVLSVLSCIFPLNIGFSQDNTTSHSGNLGGSNADRLAKTEAHAAHQSAVVHIKFYDRTIYYVDRPIYVEFEIVNNEYEPYLFVTSFNKMFTFDFEIRTVTNRLVAHSRDYTLGTTQFEPILNDKIALKRNEIYGVRIDIARWFDLFEPGEYVIRGLFYPHLKTGLDSDVRIYSENQLFLDLNPPYTEELRMVQREEEMRKLMAESLPPYEVVRVMLEALQDNDFEVYFLYVDFEKFIDQFENARTLYREARDVEKPAIIENLFKPYLMGENELEDIPFDEHIPRTFDIVRTEIEKDDAIVEVLEDFEYGRFSRRKRYRYFLHLFDDKWFLQKYEVVNLP